MDDLLKLFLQHCHFVGVNRDGLNYKYDSTHCWSVPDYPERYYVDLTFQFDGMVLLEAKFLEKTLDYVVVPAKDSELLQFLYEWPKQANWRID